MGNIKEYLIKQKELNDELSKILSSVNSVTTLEEKEELKILQKDTIDGQINNISLLKNQIIARLNDNQNPVTSSERKSLINLVTDINKLNDDYTRLQKQVNYHLTKDSMKTKSTRTISKEMKSNINTTKHTDNISINKSNKSISEFIGKSEKNIGFNLINFIGLLLLIIGLCTFGKHVYTYYLNDFMRGLSLLIISFGLIGLGEEVFTKINPKFSETVTGLGLSSLYITIIINYLILGNINLFLAMLFTCFASFISIVICFRQKYSYARIITLIGSYIALISTQYDNFNSIMLIITVVILNILNIYFKRKDHEHEILANIIIITNVIFLLIIGLFINIQFVGILAIIYILIINYLEKTILSQNNIIPTIAKLIISLIVGLVLPIYFVIGFIVLFILTDLLNKKINNINLACISIIIMSCPMFYHMYYIRMIIMLVLIAITAYTANIYKGSILLNVITFLQLITLTYLAILGDLFCVAVLFIGLIITLYCYTKQKNTELFTGLIYFSLGIIIIVLNFTLEHYIYDFEPILLFVLNIVFIAYLLTINITLDLTYKKNINKVFLIVSIIFNILIIITSEVGLLLIFNIIMSIGILVGILNPKYIKTNIYNKKSIIISIISIIYITVFNPNIVIFDILLMLIAIINVYLGFILKDKLMRKTGIGIAIFTCIKLLLFDMIGVGYTIKTIAFIIVGILALVISYIYSKIEEKYDDTEDK